MRRWRNSWIARQTPHTAVRYIALRARIGNIFILAYHYVLLNRERQTLKALWPVLLSKFYIISTRGTAG